jgi:hypothetical protein
LNPPAAADPPKDAELYEVYQFLPDQKTTNEGFFRTVDESGEDYLHPAECFIPLKLPAAIVREFASSLITPR